MQNRTNELSETKRKLVDAGVALMRQRGYSATTVDDICRAAGVTKGGFFHYFKSKEDLAVAALARFGYDKNQDFHDAPFRKLADPLQRVYGRLDFILASMGGPDRTSKGCLVGTLAQEVSLTNPALRSVCYEWFTRMAEDFARDLAAAKALYAPEAEFDPKRVAWLATSVLQGSMMLAKASESNAVLVENLQQFRTHLDGLFRPRTLVAGQPSLRPLPVDPGALTPIPA